MLMADDKKLLLGNSRRANAVTGCPLTAALAAVGGKWKLIIIYWLAESLCRDQTRDVLDLAESSDAATPRTRERRNYSAKADWTRSGASRVLVDRLWSIGVTACRGCEALGPRAP